MISNGLAKNAVSLNHESGASANSSANNIWVEEYANLLRKSHSFIPHNKYEQMLERKENRKTTLFWKRPETINYNYLPKHTADIDGVNNT